MNDSEYNILPFFKLKKRIARHMCIYMYKNISERIHHEMNKKLKTLADFGDKNLGDIKHITP